jgi:hypothetical protein
LGGPVRSEARRPDFFILGAPKCGTTSLAAWLAGHPAIFLSAVKEPHFFNTDDRQGVSSLAEYERLFADARGMHAAIGEASVWYLSSATAVPNILAYQPAARFIVMLRSPVNMAPALHAEMVLGGHETVRDFRTAWHLQDARRHGECLPALSWARRRLLYGEACALGAQLDRLLGIVPRPRVLIILLEDMARAPRQEYQRALQFLGVPDDGRTAFPVHNAARAARYPGLTRALFVVAQVKRRLGIRLHAGLWDRVAAFNMAPRPRPPLAPDMLALLRHYFSEDIAVLERLLQRDLSHWLDRPAVVHSREDLPVCGRPRRAVTSLRRPSHAGRRDAAPACVPRGRGPDGRRAAPR